ncbi:unnamed protein product, partial [Meganyctiphanes norvegica]
MGVGWSDVGVEGVPLELVYRVLRHVSLKDLTTLSATCTYLRALVDESPLLWSHVHTKELWPSEKTWHWFERAANSGNVGASIKLAVALLYNEGVNFDNKPVVNGSLAVSLFERLETSATLGSRSHLWLLYRPPWGAHPSCCKRYCHTRVAHIAQMTGASWASRVLSRIAEVGADSNGCQDSQQLGITPGGVNWVKVSAEGGDVHARLLLWRSRYEKRHKEGTLDPGTELQAVRELREMGLHGYFRTTLTLMHFLATSRRLGDNSLSEIRDFIQSAPPSTTLTALNYQQNVTPHMHHVLIDWLCEVANMKLHSSVVLHTATQIIEAYLSVEQVKSNQLQLIGITSLLLATRFIPGASILTIREASWVTDYTYTYNDVVRTIGHLMAALQAILAYPTILDYATVVLEAIDAPELVCEWTYFLTDLAITCSFPPKISLGKVGASCVFLAYILSGLPCPNLLPATGFTQIQLLQPALIAYSKNFDMEGNKCQRRGILDRYSLTFYSKMKVATQPVPSLEELLALQGISENEYLSMVIIPSSLEESHSSMMETETTSSESRCSQSNYSPYKRQPMQNTTLGGLCRSPVSFSKSSSLFNCKVSDNPDNILRISCGGVRGGTRIRYNVVDGLGMECTFSKSSLRVSEDKSPISENPSKHIKLNLNLNRSNVDVSIGYSNLCDDIKSDDSSSEHSSIGQVPGLLSSPDSEEIPESSELLDATLTQTTSDPEDNEASFARVSLKRKLDNSPGGERPEKCLILDVGKLQLN